MMSSQHARQDQDAQGIVRDNALYRFWSWFQHLHWDTRTSLSTSSGLECLRESLMSFLRIRQTPSINWVRAPTRSRLPSSKSKVSVRTKAGCIQTPFIFLTWCTTAVCVVPGTTLRYALALSVWMMMLPFSLTYLAAISSHTALRIGPGPGALLTVDRTGRGTRMRLAGWPRRMIPRYCTQVCDLIRHQSSTHSHRWGGSHLAWA